MIFSYIIKYIISSQFFNPSALQCFPLLSSSVSSAIFSPLSGVKRAVKYVNEFLAPALCNQVN